jgi:hypothetical protein
MALTLLIGLLGMAFPAFAAQMTFLPVTVDFPQMLIKTKIVSLATVTIDVHSFEVCDNGTPVSGVHVQRATARQSLTLLLDRSSSLENVIGEVRRSAAGFVSALPTDVKTSLISFAGDIDMAQDFTFDKSLILHAIHQVRAWGGTALYDAACLAIEQLHIHSDPRDLKTLVLFTDGRDETPVGRKQMSIKDFPEVLRLAKQYSIRIIPVALGTEIDEEKLKEMAKLTGGFFLHAPTVKELFGVYQKLAQRMKMEHIFNIGFLSPHPIKDGSRHRVKILTRLEGQSFDREVEYFAPLDPKHLDKVPAEPRPLDIAMPQLPPTASVVASLAMPVPATPAVSLPIVPQALETSILRDPVFPRPKGK